MTRMMPRAQCADIADIHAAPQRVTAADRAAAAVGLADAGRVGVRARLFLQRHPHLLRLVERLFGFGVDNGLADARLESIRRFALGEALAGRAASSDMLVRRWSVAG